MFSLTGGFVVVVLIGDRLIGGVVSGVCVLVGFGDVWLLELVFFMLLLVLVEVVVVVWLVVVGC